MQEEEESMKESCQKRRRGNVKDVFFYYLKLLMSQDIHIWKMKNKKNIMMTIILMINLSFCVTLTILLRIIKFNF